MTPRGRAVLVALAAGGAAILAHRAIDKRHRRTLLDRAEQDAFDELDWVTEPEPPGLVYDQTFPCVGRDGTILVSDEEGCIHPKDLEPLTVDDVPFAEGSSAPVWPLRTDHPQALQVSYIDAREKWHGRWGREFGASRKSTDKKSGKPIERRHAGVDLFADEGDTVVAMEDGTVLAILPFHHGAWAIYILNDTGDIVNYGEVEQGTWWRFGIRPGSRVRQGQRLAKLGKMRTDTMLHIETYENGSDIQQTIEDIRKGRFRWVGGDPPPPDLLDPTRYLLAAQRTALAGQ